MLPTTVRKKALLIGCPQAQGSTYLQGVSLDLFHFRNFLYSPRFGCFLNDEIICLPNPTVEELLWQIRNISCDYLFVYFSGHGYTDSATGNRMICLKNGNLADTRLYANCRIQFVLIDACRNFVGRVSGLPQYGDPLDGEVIMSPIARNLFDWCIANMNEARIIVHAT